MRSVETEGGSIDEAIDRALAALRVTRDQVAIEILENASRGLFGFGSRRARVRATVRAPLGDGDRAPERVTAVSRETPDVPGKPGSSQAAADRAREVLDVVLPQLVESPRIAELAGESGTIRLSLGGVDGGMLIGRRGQTLDALEHLVNRIVFRDETASALRIALDVEGYRERRQESLEQLAHRLAGKARETGRPVTLNPMSPRDRRVVHLALQDDPAVSTASEGEGHYRRLVIIPQNGRRGGSTARSR